MSTPTLIAPSILSADFSQLGEQIAEVERSGADWLHIDVMDGHFVPNISMGPLIVETLKRISKLPLDVHLMIAQPEKYLKTFTEAGADHITIHVEASEKLNESLQAIKELGCKAGVVLKPNTGVKKIEAFLQLADIVLVMSVEPGFGGQGFMPEVLPKVRKIRSLLEHHNPEALIEIDGGINAESLPLAKEAGVNVFVAGSSVFNHPNGIGEGMAALKEAAGFPLE